MTEPPIAPTDLWKTLWQEEALHTKLHDALDTLTDGTYRSARVTLVEDWGVTAPASTAAPTYAEYLLDGGATASTKEFTPSRVAKIGLTVQYIINVKLRSMLRSIRQAAGG